MRKIIHIDMDAFFAAVEQRDNPQLKGKPVIVGGRPDSRGVVSTCSYEARKYGIHSAMPSSQAYRLCPTAIFLPPRFKVYSEASRKVFEILYLYSELVEPLSIDEAFLDVSGENPNAVSARDIALEIKKRIYQETGLTASAGVSYNKFLAKIASDFQKPDGLTVIPPERAQEFIDALDIGKFFGVGKVTKKRFLELGIKNGKDLRCMSQLDLQTHFGKMGSVYYAMARGIDNRPVSESYERKSVGRERTFALDLTDLNEMKDVLWEIAEEVETRLKRNEFQAKTLTVKVKYSNFKSVTRSITLHTPIQTAKNIMEYVPELLEKTEAGQVPVRLLGISTSGFRNDQESNEEDVQLILPFDV